MKNAKRYLIVLLISIFITNITFVPLAISQSAIFGKDGILLGLTSPGKMVNLSPAFEPLLIKGLKVHPENPFKFDFIVDLGDEKLNNADFTKSTQRMANYFLTSLAIPEKDLWVNLSPIEKNQIIPDSLIKTELGRDLLAEDYMLKQISASLIYPENDLGKKFWKKVYDEAYRKFRITQVPVNIFNKIWILPQDASIYEKGNTVFITKAHLKVMLEEDYLAQSRLGLKVNETAANAPVKDLTKQVLRQVIVPAIEKEVNEGKNFAQLRQVFYSLILAQWYKDVFKRTALNKLYSGKSKVAGIDVNNPRNKELIYRQYLSAYKKGVFNYIKEETDQVSQLPIPRKYFSGGFIGRHVDLKRVSTGDFGMISPNAVALQVNLQPANSAMITESRSEWNDLNRPLMILGELHNLLENGKFKRDGLYDLIDRYSQQVESQKLYPVQSAWPVLKAITLLEKSQEDDLVKALQERYTLGQRPVLVDKIILMNSDSRRDNWLNDWVRQRTPHLVGRMIYLVAAEIHYWAGGLGPVMKFHGKGMKDLGADVSYIEPWYQLRRDKGNPQGDPLNYEDSDIGLKDMNYDYFKDDPIYVDVGEDKHIKLQIATGIDENGLRVYMFKDVRQDGSSKYTKMLYNYWEPRLGSRDNHVNPITKEESMAFLSMATARLLERLETQRKIKDGETWKSSLVHSNDGQYAPLQAVTMSQFGTNEVIKDIFWAFTTHTYRNRGGSGDSGTENIFLKFMMGIKNRFINAFRQSGYFDYTSGGVRLANWKGAVSDKHRDDVNSIDPKTTLISVTNGAVPEEMAVIYREEFLRLKSEGTISSSADYERPTAGENSLVKKATKTRLNEAKIKSSHGHVLVDANNPLIGYARRLVPEKTGRERAFTDENIRNLVKLGYDVVLMGNHQGYDVSEELAKGLRSMEYKIETRKKENPQDFPGSFKFVEAFTSDQKKLFLAAADIQVQDSDNHTGAAEFSEEDITANGGLQAGASWREGVISDQGIPIDFKNPGKGQTLMPEKDTPESWLETVYKPIINLWNSDRVGFYKNAALSPQLNRIQRYLITSAAYLTEYNSILDQQDIDRKSVIEVIKGLEGDKEIMYKILKNGHNEVREFRFYLPGRQELAKSGGLDDFLIKKHELEDEFGYDIFLNHLNQQDFQKYLKGLFVNTGSAGLVYTWLDNLDNDPNINELEKQERLERFMKGIAAELRNQLDTDNAMLNPGGIKLGPTKFERQGRSLGDVLNDKAFEGMLIKAKGLRVIIVGVSKIPNLLDFIK